MNFPLAFTLLSDDGLVFMTSSAVNAAFNFNTVVEQTLNYFTAEGAGLPVGAGICAGRPY
jgi:hypothetical protein